MEFPIGKKLFHLVVNPGTSRCPTVDLELVQTTRNVNGTRHSVRKFQPGKRDHLFRFPLFLGIFQWDEPTKRVPFTAEPEIPDFWLNGKRPLGSRFFGISREPQTSISHVTSTLQSGLRFEVHVCTARSRSRGKWKVIIIER